MGFKIAICMLPMFLAAWSATLSNLDCNTVCADPHRHDESDAVHCGCHNPHVHPNHHVTTSPEKSSYERTTLGLCDYLCSIQMGGSACDCSISIVPGKRGADV